MSGFETRLWRVLHRVLLVLMIGVLGLLLGLGSRPERIDSVFGLLIVLIVALPVAMTLARMPVRARQALRVLPSHRPLLTATAAVLGCVTLLVLWWTVVNALFPGTLSPLALALVGVVVAGMLALLGKLVRRR